MKRYLDKMLLYKLFRLSFGYLRNIGWLKSVRQGFPVRRDGSPLPWFSYAAIEFLQDRVNREMSVFEYGCGYSTLWWAAEIRDVISCEHNIEWYELISLEAPDNVHLSLVEFSPNGDYCRAVAKYNSRFDIIVIDGEDRVNCAINSVGALKPKGVIIWDNSERLEYKDGFDYLISQGFNRIDFTGLGPLGIYAWSTSIFYRSENCLCI